MFKNIRKLCTPAYVYLVISVIAIVAMLFQNSAGGTVYCVGDYECEVASVPGIFIGKAIYVAFWTFILNAICKAGYKGFSWFLVLFPLILMAVLIGLILLSGMKEGMSCKTKEEDDVEGHAIY